MKFSEARSIFMISVVSPRNKSLSSLLLWQINQYFKKDFPLEAPEQNWCHGEKVFPTEKVLGFWTVSLICHTLVQPTQNDQAGGLVRQRMAVVCVQKERASSLLRLKQLCLNVLQVNVDGDGHANKPHHSLSVCHLRVLLEALEEVGHPEQTEDLRPCPEEF